jgi:hypothetical protein
VRDCYLHANNIEEINGVRKKQHHSHPVMAAFHNPWLVHHTMAVVSHTRIIRIF